MSALRILAGASVAILAAQVASASSVYTLYRGVSIGDSPSVVVAALKMKPTDVAVVTERPALVEQLTWRPNQFFTGKTAPTDALAEMVLTFHRGQLAHVVAIYERDRIEGLTDPDLLDAFSAVYGKAMLVPTPTKGAVPGESTVIGRWGDGETLVVLWREAFPRRVKLTVSSIAGDRMLQAALVSGKRLDAIAAPAWDVVRQTSEDFTRRLRTERARVGNKAAFKP
jgi:hypothetical protein